MRPPATSRLNDAIREELGATYSIEATSNVVRLPKPEYRVRINWTCDPARVDSLAQRVFQEIEAEPGQPVCSERHRAENLGHHLLLLFRHPGG